MTKFFLMTRGRTGSTAVLDELGKSRGICAAQELFIKRDFSMEQAHMYEFLPPFDLWKPKPHGLAKLIPIRYRDAGPADQYLAEAEKRGARNGAQCFGFKVLSHHFDQRPYLKKLLKRRGYRALYLTRNLARQVISGMVAKQRGIYNTNKEFVDPKRYIIDLNKFQEAVEWGARSIKKDCARIEAAGFDYRVVAYEQFTKGREVFFNSIFDFLGIESEVPEASSYSVMIKDARATIANYDAVEERARSMGFQLED